MPMFFGNLFGSRPAPPPKALEPPKVTDPEVQEARRKGIELERRRRGRSSTLLTGPLGLESTDKKKEKKTMLGGGFIDV